MPLCSARGLLWVVIAAVLSSCSDAPVGVPPGWEGLGVQVTNPNGGGPQVTRFGPPDPQGEGCYC
jgi:hypothetical protein